MKAVAVHSTQPPLEHAYVLLVPAGLESVARDELLAASQGNALSIELPPPVELPKGMGAGPAGSQR